VTRLPSIDRRAALAGGTAALTAALAPAAVGQTKRKPNVVIVLADDLGYGDVGVYGSRMIRTPMLDRMAREGAKLTSFYASANICTPSRAGLLTGRYPIRTGLGHQVIQPNDERGLPHSEVTLAEALKPDYQTALVGKWHLGHVAPHWPPTGHGFDLFFGLPYSHDMKPLSLYSSEPGVELTQEDVDFPKLTERFFGRGLRFIEDNREKPFFLLLALTAPHVPLNPHPDHAGHRLAVPLLAAAEDLARDLGLPALSLTTFRSVPWNAPYYERLGFAVMPIDAIGPGLRIVIARQKAAGLDVANRVAMRRPLP